MKGRKIADFEQVFVSARELSWRTEVSREIRPHPYGRSRAVHLQTESFERRDFVFRPGARG